MNCELCLLVSVGLVTACMLFSDGNNASPFCAVCNVHFRLSIGDAMMNTFSNSKPFVVWCFLNFLNFLLEIQTFLMSKLS